MDQCYSGYRDFYEDLVFNIENCLRNYDKYHNSAKIHRLSPSQRAMICGRDLVDYYNDL
jgi:hypothetical protein